MGRGRKRKIRHVKRKARHAKQWEGRHMRVAVAPPGNSMKTKHKLIDRSVLEDLWLGGQCSRQNTTAGLYGRCVMIGRDDCSMIKLLMRFGRPKTFDVFVLEDSERYVGRASARDVREFIQATGVTIFTPSVDADLEGESPERDSMMLGIMIELLSPDVVYETAAAVKGDFVKAWNSINCKHEHASCQVRGDHIGLICLDCASVLLLRHTKHDMFSVSITRRPLGPVPYGLHGADVVINAIRKYTSTLEIPWPMADKMSDDPDRDARSVWKITSLLERYGLLERLDVPERGYNEVINVVSAASCGRVDFERWIEPLSSAIRTNKTKFIEYGKRISERRMLEAMRLIWPYWYGGVGIDVELYDPTGDAEHCVRCDFSTQDDDQVDSDHWERGCPECGYDGYLLDMDKGEAGAVPGSTAHTIRRP